MKITITNLGAIDYAEVELGDFTVICGENNTGKTYVTYAIYGFLQYWHEGFYMALPDEAGNELRRERSIVLDMEPFVTEPSLVLNAACREFVEHLPQVFAASEKRFSRTSITVEASPIANFADSEFERTFSIGGSQLIVTKAPASTEIVASIVEEKSMRRIPVRTLARLVGRIAKDAIFGGSIPKPFIASAERTGTAIFKNELNLQRNRMIEEIGRIDGECDPFELLNRVYSDYPMPVKSNINFARKREDIAKKESFIAKGYRDILIEYEDIIGGQFDVGKDDQLRFTPKGARVHLSMDESSSSVRSLLDLGLYLSSVASRGDLLIIDEPELNLHPQNQRRVARLLSRLVHLGMKVLVTTHSDYFIKELNLLIMMHSTDSRIVDIADREGYSQKILLEANSVRAYVASSEMLLKPGKRRRSRCRTLTQMPVDCEAGISIGSFDSAIEDLNRIEDEIVYGE